MHRCPGLCKRAASARCADIYLHSAVQRFHYNPPSLLTGLVMSLLAFNYGSDDAGLVWGFLIGEGVGTVPINAPDALKLLREPVPSRPP